MQALRKLLALALFLVPFSATAQDRSPPAPGDVLRLHRHAAMRSPVKLRLVSLRSDSLLGVETRRGDTVRVALSDLSRLDLRTGQKSHWLAGGLIGLAGGAVIGGVIGKASADEDQWFGELEVVGGVLVGGTAGALAGVVTGAMIRTDRWTALDLDALRVRPIAGPRGTLGLALSRQFRL